MARRTSQIPPDDTPHPADLAQHDGTSQATTPQPVAMADFLGPGMTTQATRVQMAAAVAEVQAMVITAKAHPRDENQAQRALLRACGHPTMAEAAFYEYSRGDGQVRGITVELAREALRCWGNAQSGIIELQRVPPTGTEPGRSEMQAWAWDMETNTRMSTTFWADHTRDAKGKTYDLKTARDIYESNANQGARRERAMIERILPAWFIEVGRAECYRTLTSGDPAEHPNRVRACINKFARLGVSQEMLEARIGSPHGAWGAMDLATLTVVFRSLERGETTVAEAFDAEPSTAAASTNAALAAPVKDASGPPDPDAKRRANAAKSITAAFRQARFASRTDTDQATRLFVLAGLARAHDTDPPRLVASMTDLDTDALVRVAEQLDVILSEAGLTDPHQRLADIAAATENEIRQAAGGEQQ